ncbi:inositol phospholipid synthesis Scs3p protein [Rutstroemia sp. NJR-2017a BBW]|nr:inositol phospholipid synthesis Scs3p protein [Rutstroemia sp. NJR-2017a BBW]
MSSPTAKKRRSQHRTPEIVTTPTTTAKMTTRKSPFIPTPFETLLLSIYPATLLIGSIFSSINPQVRTSEYSPTLQSHPASTAPSYFAKKSNVFNQLFVKKGWFWITLSYFFFLYTHPSTGPPGSLIITPRRVRGAIRWAVVTTWWIFVTQWFFGPAIIDRGFVLTGGQCELVRDAEKGRVEMDDTRQFVTGIACKAVGGKWKGGHDISGHVFLLVLGSMFLLQEVLHVVLRSMGVKEERSIVMPDGAVKSAEVEAPPYNEAEDVNQGWMSFSVKVVLGVAGLSLFMLAMTAIYFHTWFEKFTGLVVAFLGIFAAYFLPRVVPAVRSIVGMPGI